MLNSKLYNLHINQLYHIGRRHRRRYDVTEQYVCR